ncbi:DUF4345 family protein [Altererythrobacter sp. SALINAS58]|nr:DUF4345 family protein [Alteripontixanthobacter muriae]
MRLILTALLFVAGLFFVFLGIGFLLTPASSAEDFGLATSGVEGLATIRADMTAFFIVAGACMIWGAWRRKGDPLLISAALFAIAFVGRAINAIAVEPYDGFWAPMLVEALAVALCLAAYRMLPHQAFAGGLNRQLGR